MGGLKHQMKLLSRGGRKMRGETPEETSKRGVLEYAGGGNTRGK